MLDGGRHGNQRQIARPYAGLIVRFDQHIAGQAFPAAETTRPASAAALRLRDWWKVTSNTDAPEVWVLRALLSRSPSAYSGFGAGDDAA